MSYYTERHGLRNPISKTYTISILMYSLLLSCCEKYYNYLSWKYPENCPDGHGCCGLDRFKLESDLIFEIPTIFRDDRHWVSSTTTHHIVFHEEVKEDEYDQFALLDYIEFFAQNIRDYENGNYHGFFGHYHFILKTTDSIFKKFQAEINEIFKKTGLLYYLSDEKIIERVVEYGPLTTEIELSINKIPEDETRKLLKEAISYYRQPYPNSSREATEKIWDALERLKTYYTNVDKKASVSKIVEDMANGDINFIDLFNNEFKVLTEIGNNFRIRHHETNRIDITDPQHYDYFFNRCLSLIALAIQYLE